MERSKVLRAAEEEKGKPQENPPFVIQIVAEPGAVAAEQQRNEMPMPQEEEPDIPMDNLVQHHSPMPGPKGLYAQWLDEQAKQPAARRSRYMSDPAEYIRPHTDPGFVHYDQSTICDQVLNMQQEHQQQQGLDQDSPGQPGAAQSPSSSDVPFPASADQGTDPGPSTSTDGS